ncbi:MAG: pyrroline-5-carboxylate reductase [Pseudomonadota bacterium]
MSGNITFVGGGNMAMSLIGGLVENNYPSKQICVCEPDDDKRANLERTFGIRGTAENNEGVAKGDTVVLAETPQIMEPVVTALASAAQTHQPLVVSIAAGIREPALAHWLGYDAAIVRTMPNTPSLLGLGATALYANARVSDDQRAQADTILRAARITLWVENEDLIDAVTAVSGSGPAYFFYLMELMIEAGERLGLSEASAKALTLQTALGAARMALDSGEAPGTLRERVTSPGGTTERALNIFREGGLGELVDRALTGARDRSEELGAAAAPAKKGN